MNRAAKLLVICFLSVVGLSFNGCGSGGSGGGGGNNQNPTTPTVTVTPASNSIAAAQSLAVTVTVTGSDGVATGSVVLSGGGYTSAATTLVAGSVTLTIAAGSLATGSDMLSATYTPDSSSSSKYNSASGTSTLPVTVNAPLATPTVTVTPASPSITTSQSLNVTVTAVSYTHLDVYKRQDYGRRLRVRKVSRTVHHRYAGTGL